MSGETHAEWITRKALEVPKLSELPPGNLREAIEAYLAKHARGEVRDHSTDDTPFRTTERKLTP